MVTMTSNVPKKKIQKYALARAHIKFVSLKLAAAIFLRSLSLARAFCESSDFRVFM
jgi:hypothetical protein